MTELLKKLCAPIAVSGREDALRAVIQNEIEPYCDKVYTDRIGNLIAEKRGVKKANHRIMLAAHMDEVGIIVTHITDSGLIKFSAVGGVDPRLMPGKRVIICAKGSNVHGVIGTVPPHLIDKEKASAVLGEDELYINIGCESKEEALSLVSLGDVGTFDGDFTPLKNGKLMARALDDRCGCAVLISLLKSQPACDITAVFTVQEEIGCRGAQVAAAGILPHTAIVLDSTTACDINDTPDEKTVCCLSDGAVISFMDRGCAYDRELFSLVVDTAKKHKIKAQLKRAVAGANDSSAIHKTLGGVKTAAISLPCRYLHTPNCVIDTADLSSVYNLVSALLEKIDDL